MCLIIKCSFFLELLRKKQRAINEKNTQQLAQICRKLGDMYGENQKHQDALEQYREEAKAYNNINMRLEAARANRMMGEMYMLLENFDEALKYGLKYLSKIFVYHLYFLVP